MASPPPRCAGRWLTLAEAESAGLVHRVVPAVDLLDVARSTTVRIARRSPVLVREVKRTVYGPDRDLAEIAAFLTSSTTSAAAISASA